MTQFYADIERAFPRNRYGQLRLAPIPVTLTLALLNVAVFAADSFYFGAENLRTLNSWGSFDPGAVWSGEWWRLVTHAFVHADSEHLFVNLVWLLFFGYVVEPAIGRVRYLPIYLVSSAVTGLVAMAFDPAPSCGASAAILGIGGVGLALVWRARGGWWKPEIIIPRWTWTIVIAWFFWGESADPLTNDLAHLTGFLTGVGFGCTIPVGEWASRRAASGLFMRYAGLLAVILTVSLLAGSAVWQPRWWYVQAERAVDAGDWQTARKYLGTLERVAIPARYYDAMPLIQTADLYIDHGDDLYGRALLETLAPVMDAPYPYVMLAASQAFTEPYMEQEALSNFREALGRDPQYRLALVGLAWLKLSAEDSTIFDPESARNLAKQAVKLTGGTVPSELHVLAEAQFECGNHREAIRLLERALRLEAEDPGFYEDALSEMKAARDSIAALTKPTS